MEKERKGRQQAEEKNIELTRKVTTGEGEGRGGHAPSPPPPLLPRKIFESRSSQIASDTI